jgi:hypothetical protein
MFRIVLHRYGTDRLTSLVCPVMMWNKCSTGGVLMHLRRLLAVPLAVPVALLALAGFTQTSDASVGVGVQASPVRLGGMAHRGDRFALPLDVVNTGTEAEAVSMRVERLSRGPGRAVPPSWIQFPGSAVQIAPGKAARVSLELVIPGRAKPGGYLSDIVVSGSATGQAGTGNFGVAAATKLEFSVSSAPAQGASSFPVWMWWAIAGLLLLTVTVFGVRRSGLRIRVERGSGHLDAVDHQGEPHG